MSVFRAQPGLQQNGSNHFYTLLRIGGGTNGGEQPIGICIYDPARNQFAFAPNLHNLILQPAEITEIVAILNSLTR